MKFTRDTLQITCKSSHCTPHTSLIMKPHPLVFLLKLIRRAKAGLNHFHFHKPEQHTPQRLQDVAPDTHKKEQGNKENQNELCLAVQALNLAPNKTGTNQEENGGVLLDQSNEYQTSRQWRGKSPRPAQRFLFNLKT